jgi:delta 1-pyrroline-5-carboxylate dehydrogenase
LFAFVVTAAHTRATLTTHSINFVNAALEARDRGDRPTSGEQRLIGRTEHLDDVGGVGPRHLRAAGQGAAHDRVEGPPLLLRQHLERLAREATPLLDDAASPPIPEGVPHLVRPQAFEVRSIADLRQEIFGPVLHIVRWSGDPTQVIDQINALGYGLTLGIQTRIDSRAQALAHAAHVGNVYINRNQIGAVVGVQPFGGEGLSGTGPKAGGPHYLYRFCAEQTVTINTTAAGGNAALLAGEGGRN